MNFDCVRAREFPGVDGHWYRIEVYRDAEGHLRTASYRREFQYWQSHANQLTEMEQRVFFVQVQKEIFQQHPSE